MPLPPPPFEARVARGRALSPNVRELTFERVDGQPMAFEAGQWLNVFMPTPDRDTPETVRSYSIASAPDGSPRFEIAVTRVQDGPASSWLHAVEPGTVLRCVGPMGFFTRSPKDAPPSLMIATGTGVTPIRAMMRAAVTAGSTAPMWLLFGTRHEEDIIYADEWSTLTREHPFVRFLPTLSQPQTEWQGRRGYVQTHVKDLWADLVALGAGTPHAYICGLERMISSVRELLRKDLGLPRQQVHSERYD